MWVKKGATTRANLKPPIPLARKLSFDLLRDEFNRYLHAFRPPELFAFTKVNKLPIRTAEQSLLYQNQGIEAGPGNPW